ncbi:hypothetical protein FIBSPDRAFT_5989 [Athelia psychrophila]|uniref:Uncharacterized protein n=1 Tax=Athelia psychrophila TaxID=1759441 RepID=A0A166X1Y3_9AGAM|nr:hypothetical protein FIBSPDRAFT_5989 [Fibularhizoctonia sp. CBS 109695]
MSENIADYCQCAAGGAGVVCLVCGHSSKLLMQDRVAQHNRHLHSRACRRLAQSGRHSQLWHVGRVAHTDMLLRTPVSAKSSPRARGKVPADWRCA